MYHLDNESTIKGHWRKNPDGTQTWVKTHNRKMNEKTRMILESYYGWNESIKSIAQNYEMEQSAIKNIINKHQGYVSEREQAKWKKEDELLNSLTEEEQKAYYEKQKKEREAVDAWKKKIGMI